MTTEQSVGAASHTSLNWRQIDWHSVNRNVRRLQVRIVKAVEAGRWGKVKALQRMLTHSRDAKLLAVRRVTENKGRQTPGVDGITWNAPGQKMAAVKALRSRGYRPLPLRRIYIPKSNGKLRPLGIPAMKDRAMQALYLLALDPVAETTAACCPAETTTVTVPPALVRMVSVRASGAVMTLLIAALAVGVPPGWCPVKAWVMPRATTMTRLAAASVAAGHGTRGRRGAWRRAPRGRPADSHVTRARRRSRPVRSPPGGGSCRVL